MEKKMSLKERLIVLFGGVTPEEAIRRAREAFQAGMEDGQDEPSLYSADGKKLGTGYKTVGSTPRDLSAISQEKAIEASYRLWQTHPLAKALIEIYVDYVLGSGATVKADNPDVQALLDTFWNDPVNALGDDEGGIGEGQEELARELFLFGEQVILAFVRSGADVGLVADGLVRFGSVDPKTIHSVITDKDNRRDVLAIRLKSATGGADGPLYKLIREKGAGRAMEGRIDLAKFREAVKGGRQETVDGRREYERQVSGKEWIVSEDGQRQIRMVEAEQPLINDVGVKGECFYVRINKISTGVRGRPELLPMIDWLDRFDQVFFDGAEHVALLNMFSWDLTIQGGSEKATEPELNLRQQAQKVSKMKPGSVYAHNEKASMEAKNPTLNTADLETMVRQLRVFIAGGARVPEHFIAEGGYTNRATADAMGDPTFKMLTKKQAIVRQMLTRLCRYQVDVAIALGLLPEEVQVMDESGQETGKTAPARKAFRVEMPDINVSDTSLAARTLALVAQAVMPLVAAQLLPKKPALQLVAAVASILGVEIDVNAALADGEGVPPVDPGILDMLKKLAQRRQGSGAPGDQGNGGQPADGMDGGQDAGA